MRRFFLFVALAPLFSLTGCLEVLEDLYLNADGSGKYQVTIDMSELFNDPMLKDLVKEEAKKETGQDDDVVLEKDSVMYFRDAPEFSKLSPEEQAVIKDVAIMIKASESKGQMIMQMVFPFRNMDDFKKINEAMKKLEENKDAGANPTAMMGNGMFGTQGAQFALKKGVLTRLPMSDTKGLFGDDDQNMAMAKMFFQGATYTTVYHLPGKVKKTNIPNAKVEGNTVIVENNFLDILDGKAKVEGDVKFKKK